MSIINLPALSSLLSGSHFHPFHAQNSIQDYLNSHNEARTQVVVANRTWDNTVTTNGQSYANKRISDCNLMHLNGPYGENLNKGTGTFSASCAVSMWVAKKEYHDYNSNSCVGRQECQHYTQMVWRNSVWLGCTGVECNNGWWLVICKYDPPLQAIMLGNIPTMKAYIYI